MGWMLPTCLFKTNSRDPTSRHDTDGGTWPQMMCLHISKKSSTPLTESSWTKQFHKSSYTILKGPLDEKRGKCVKVKNMFFYPKQDSSLDENHWQKKGGQL
jgi:hypothetical protein